MAQRRAACFEANNDDWNLRVTDMLQHLEWEKLKINEINFVPSQCTK